MPRGGDRGGRKPKILPELKRITVSISINPILWAVLKTLAKEKGVSLSAYVEQMLLTSMEFQSLLRMKSSFKGIH